MNRPDPRSPRKGGEDRERHIKRIISREYRIFKEEEALASLPRTLYEKACNRSEKWLKIEPGKKSGKSVAEAIEFCHLNVTPRGAMSFTVLFAIASIIATIAMMALFLPADIGILLLFIVMFFTYYIYAYPFHLKRKYEVEMSSEIVTFVLYMAMYMRNVPSLEGAVKFASENISGYLGYELKKMLWDVEVGNYLSMKEALINYSRKWGKNREFIESVELMITSLSQMGDKRIKMLDESVNIILEGTREHAKNFNQQLKLPVMVVHALGIILPVMGLVLFPLISIFLHVGSTILFMGYDVVLPLVLYFIIVRILESRPVTFSKIDISENPDVPPKGKFFMGKKAVRAWPIGLVVGALIITLGIVMANAEAAAAVQEGIKFQGIVPAILITFGIALGLGIYFLLLARTRWKVRAQTRKVEGEFAEALFQLGSQLSGGVPIEVSIERSMDRIENLKIKDLFQKALNNMKMLGYTFQQAFFDPEYGAVRYYPSKMIKSVIHTVVESTKKGVNTASQAMLTVSRYLKGLHSTQEEVKEELSDTLNSLKFQAYFLSPMISGVIVTMAIIIIQILQQINIQTSNLGAAGELGFGSLSSLFGGISITPFEFIIVVGIYLIETSIILAMFINQIESGDDDTGMKQIGGNALVIGYIVFIIIFFFTLAIFGPLISTVT